MEWAGFQVPIAEIAERQATTSTESSTAYSTAAGPSSSRRKFLKREKGLLTDRLPRGKENDCSITKCEAGNFVSDFSSNFP